AGAGGGVEGWQRRWAASARRAGAEVAADGGTVADQPGGELGEQLRQHRNPAVEAAFDLGEAQRRTDLDGVGPDAESPQLGEPVDGDDECGAGSAEVDLDSPVGRARHDGGVRALL